MVRWGFFRMEKIELSYQEFEEMIAWYQNIKDEILAKPEVDFYAQTGLLITSDNSNGIGPAITISDEFTKKKENVTDYSKW